MTFVESFLESTFNLMNISLSSVSQEDDVLLLVPKVTSPSSCIQIHCIRENSFVDIIASEYECLYGHRKSQLLLEMKSLTGEDMIVLEEEENCDIPTALQYIHSESPALCFSNCSALTYAHTGLALKMERLCQQIVDEASIVLKIHLHETDSKVHDMRITVWDSIAILNLLGDPQNLLPQIDFIKWIEKKPTLFADETLFDSCRQIYSPTQLADIIMNMHCHYESSLLSMSQLHEADLEATTARYDTLASETILLLKRYEGCRLRIKGKIGHNQVGVIQKAKIISSAPKLSVLWRHNALTTDVSMDELFAKYEVLF